MTEMTDLERAKAENRIISRILETQQERADKYHAALAFIVNHPLTADEMTVIASQAIYGE